jgi:hypothetical protein
LQVTRYLIIGDVKCAIHIVLKDKEPVLVVASSFAEKQDWIQALNRAIAEADKRKGLFIVTTCITLN